jgi:hypothetical protein
MAGACSWVFTANPPTGDAADHPVGVIASHPRVAEGPARAGGFGDLRSRCTLRCRRSCGGHRHCAVDDDNDSNGRSGRDGCRRNDDRALHDDRGRHEHGDHDCARTGSGHDDRRAHHHSPRDRAGHDHLDLELVEQHADVGLGPARHPRRGNRRARLRSRKPGRRQPRRFRRGTAAEARRRRRDLGRAGVGRRQPDGGIGRSPARQRAHARQRRRGRPCEHPAAGSGPAPGPLAPTAVVEARRVRVDRSHALVVHAHSSTERGTPLQPRLMRVAQSAGLSHSMSLALWRPLPAFPCSQ